MSSNKQHSPQHEDLLKKQSLEQQEVKEVLNFIKKYAKPAAIVVITVCALFLVQDRSSRSLEFFDRCVRIEAHNKDLTIVLCKLEQFDVAHMEKIKAAIRKHNFLSAATYVGAH